MTDRQNSGFFVAFFTSIIVSIGTSLVMYFIVFPRLGIPPTYNGRTTNNQTVVVPVLKGRTLSQARSILGQIGLKMEVVAHRHHQNPAGTILAHSPPSGTQTSKGTVIQMSISLGPHRSHLNKKNVVPPKPTITTTSKIKVPNVKRMHIRKAKRKIRHAGLVVGRITFDDDEDISPNWVLRQTPSAGRYVSRGTKINLVINKD